MICVLELNLDKVLFLFRSSQSEEFIAVQEPYE